MTINANQVTVNGVGISNACNAIDVSGNTDTIVNSQFLSSGVGCSAIIVGRQTSTGNTVDLTLFNDLFEGGGGQSVAVANLADGITIRDLTGGTISNIQVYGSRYGTVLAPGNGQLVEYIAFTNSFLGDTTHFAGLFVDAGGGATIRGIFISNCWFAALATPPTFGWANQPLVQFDNTGGGVIDDVRMTNSYFVGAQAQNILIVGGTHYAIENSTICAPGFGAPGTESAIYLYANVSNVFITNNRIANACPNGQTPATAMAYSIYLATSSSNSGLMITNNSLGGATGAINGTAGPSSIVANNIGIDVPAVP
jgi:hypothetical protein